MNPRTDRERCLVLEARVAELEAEVAEWRRMDTSPPIQITEGSLTAIRTRLRKAYAPAGGQMIATMLQALLASSPKPVSRDRLFNITRDRNSWALEDGDRRGIDVQICKARKALANMGHHEVIQTMNGQGWSIDLEDAEALKAALGV